MAWQQYVAVRSPPRRWFTDPTQWWLNASCCYLLWDGRKGIVDDFGNIVVVKISERMTGDLSEFNLAVMERIARRERRLKRVAEGRNGASDRARLDQGRLNSGNPEANHSITTRSHSDGGVAL